jgi:hypothetical protein
MYVLCTYLRIMYVYTYQSVYLHECACICTYHTNVRIRQYVYNSVCHDVLHVYTRIRMYCTWFRHCMYLSVCVCIHMHLFVVHVLYLSVCMCVLLASICIGMYGISRTCELVYLLHVFV